MHYRSSLCLLVLLTAGGCTVDGGIKVYNSKPEASIGSHQDGQEVDADSPLELWGNVSDGNHDEEELQVTWYDGAEVLCATAAPNAEGRTTCATSLPLGEHNIILEVRDPANASETAGILLNAVLANNDAPVLETVSLGPDPAFEGDTLTCTPGAVNDAEGDSVSFTYAWTVNGSPLAESSTTLSSELFGRGDAVQCEVTPTDGIDVGATVASNLLTIGNTAPVATAASISPQNPAVGDTLSCAYSYSDADGDADASEIAWTINGFSAGTGPTLAASFASGDEVVCTVTPFDGTDAGSPVSARATVGNHAPELADVTLSPSIAYEGDTLSCTPGAATDVDGDTIVFDYAWVVNGVANGRSSSTLSSSYFSKGDEVYCTVTPTDGLSTGIPVDSNTVTVGNTAPEASGVSISPSNATATDDLTCTWIFADVDADADQSTVDWSVNGQSVGTGPGLSAGSYIGDDAVTCTVTPFDGSSTGTAVSRTIYIGNSAPTLDSASVSPDPAYEGDTLSCEPGTATDIDGDSVSYSYGWWVNGSALGTHATTLDGSSFDRGDSVACELTPTDGSLSGTSVVSSTIVIENSVPTLTDVTISPANPTLGSTLTCTYSYADADGDSDLSTLAWSVNGTAAGTGATKTGGFGAGDVVTCTVTPYDGTDTGSPLSASVSAGNNPPVLSSVSLSPTTAYEGDTLTCTPGSASDPEGDAIQYSYAWTVDGASPGVSTSTLSSSYFAKNNAVRCTVTPDDGTTTGAAVASNTVTISNSAPALASVAISPTTAYEGDTLSCTPGTATDPDGDNVSYTYAWYVNGNNNGRTSSTLSSTYFSRGDVVLCEATPTDGSAAGTALRSSGVTIANTVPTVSNVSISPTSPVYGQTLTCTYSFADVDSDSDASTIAWTVNGSAAGTGSTLSSGFHGGQTVSCTVTPRDSGGAGTARSASVTVGNTVPSLSSVSLTPTTAVEGSTLTCTPGTATDVDGDSISYTYSWLVDSASPGVSTSTLSSSYFSKNNAVRCSVTPRDATGSGTAVASNTVTIGNTAPVMTAVTLSPTLVYTNDTVTASASGSDVDGDPVSYSYAWSVNGTTIAAATGTTLSGVSYFSRGNLVSVAVTPNDGTQSGTAMSASVTIGNTAPTAPTVAVTPNPADMNNEPLLCGISTASTDVDGDSISYSMSWTADGVSYPGSMTGITGPSNTTWTRDTVPAADTDVGGTWICTVTPSDGTSSGATGSASTSVLDFYDVNYPATTTGPGSAAASYLLGPSITVTSATTLYRFGALLNTAGNSARMALYTDVSGSPSTLVAYSDVFTTAVGVNEVALSTPVSLPAGTYWIMGVYSATTYVYYGSSSTASIRYKAYSYSSTPSSTFGTASSYSGYPIAYYLVVAD